MASRPTTAPKVVGSLHLSVQELYGHHEEARFVEKVLRDYDRASKHGELAFDVHFEPDQLVPDLAEGKTEFSLSKDFGARQGSGRFHYVEVEGKRFSRLVWNGGERRWESATTTAKIANGTIDSGKSDPILAWIAPRPGTVALDAVVRKVASGGDGVTVELWQLLARQPEKTAEVVIGGGDVAAHPLSARREVKTGDVLALRVDARGDVRSDQIAVELKINYAGSGETPATGGGAPR
jgi:hypothetical protein